MPPTIRRKLGRVILAAIGLPLAAGLARGQPSWTDFSYTDWNPLTAPAIPGASAERHYDNRIVWDGEKFVTIQEGTRTGNYTYYYVASSRGQTDWGTPVALDIPRLWDCAHHALACAPDGFPPSDVAWAEQSQNVRYKLWYSSSEGYNHFRYGESTDGLYWHPSFLEYDYCPPTYKLDPNKYMIKPDVLYRPEGSAALDPEHPMDNRYICYLGAANSAGDPSYFEMYISSNGLDWKLHAWDGYCQARWAASTSGPAEVSEFVAFTGYDTTYYYYFHPAYYNLGSVEEVYENGERQGFLLWVDAYVQDHSIQSFYSTDGLRWTAREQPVGAIGSIGAAGAWNGTRNYGFDSVRLGESYFILRNGLYNTGAAVRKGRLSAEAETPASPSSGEIPVAYRLFHWNAETCPDAEFTFSTDGASWHPAAPAGGDSAPFATGIGGRLHTFVWDSAADLPDGAAAVYFRILPLPAEGSGSYDTTAPFAVSPAAATPTIPPPTPTIPPPTPTIPPSTPTIPPSTPTIPPPTPTLLPPTPSPAPTPWHLVVAADDYNGDGTADCGLWRGGDGTFRIRDLSLVYYGLSGDVPVPGDYGGDGRADYAVWRPSSGKWSIRGLSNGADHYYGQNGDIPAVADYDGDWRTDTALFRPSIGKWFIRGQTTFYYGLHTDTPIPGDYDGDGTADPALFRPFAGGAAWYIRHLTLLYYGQSYDLPVPGDYSGDGTTRLSVFRPSAGRWYVRGEPYVSFGQDGDIPFALDFSGDGTFQRGLYRPGQGRWSVYALTGFYFGSSGDQPVSGRSY